MKHLAKPNSLAILSSMAVFTALFSWDGMQEVTASFYDDMKTAAALAGVDVQGLANATPKPAPTTAAPSKTP